MNAMILRRGTRPRPNGQLTSLPWLMRGLIYRGGVGVRGSTGCSNRNTITS